MVNCSHHAVSIITSVLLEVDQRTDIFWVERKMLVKYVCNLLILWINAVMLNKEFILVGGEKKGLRVELRDMVDGEEVSDLFKL